MIQQRLDTASPMRGGDIAASETVGALKEACGPSLRILFEQRIASKPV